MDWIVKVGGSLFPEDAVNLSKALVGKSVMVICGGGELANLLRQYDERMDYSDTAAHKSAILCMDILGMLLADKIPGAEGVHSIDQAEKAIRDGKLPVFLPSQFLSHES